MPVQIRLTAPFLSSGGVRQRAFRSPKPEDPGAAPGRRAMTGHSGPVYFIPGRIGIPASFISLPEQVQLPPPEPFSFSSLKAKHPVDNRKTVEHYHGEGPTFRLES